MDETTLKNIAAPESVPPIMDQMLKQMKKQLAWTRICAVACIAICLLFITAFISTAVIADNASDSLDEFFVDIADLSSVVDKMVIISDDLVGISSQLTETNWRELVKNIDEMAITAQKSLEQTAAAVDELDIESLNEAIADLKTVIEPLANLMGRLS